MVCPFFTWALIVALSRTGPAAGWIVESFWPFAGSEDNCGIVGITNVGSDLYFGDCAPAGIVKAPKSAAASNIPRPDNR
jgi:hypothetical protein